MKARLLHLTDVVCLHQRHLGHAALRARRRGLERGRGGEVSLAGEGVRGRLWVLHGRVVEEAEVVLDERPRDESVGEEGLAVVARERGSRGIGGGVWNERGERERRRGC